MPIFPLTTRRTALDARHAGARGRERILTVAIAMLELFDETEAIPLGQRWSWYWEKYVPWYGISVILAELCTQTRGPLVERAWYACEFVFERWASRVAGSRKGPLWKPVARLRDHAQQARIQELAAQGLVDPALATGRKKGVWGLASMAPGYVPRRDAQWRKLHDAAIALAVNDEDTPLDIRALIPLQEEAEHPPMAGGKTPSLDFQPSYIPPPPGNIDPIQPEDWDTFLASAWPGGQAPAEDMLWTSEELGFIN